MKRNFLPFPRRQAHPPTVSLAPPLLRRPYTWALAGTTALAAAACALVLLLSACGPGVGGTGIGAEPPTLTSFGATSASVCTSNLAGSLACPSLGALPSSPSAAPADAGTTALVLADGNTRVLARLEGNRIELQAPCAGLKFSGEWGLVPGQAPRFYGAVEFSAYNGPGSLEMAATGTRFSLQVLDLNGRVLLGPLMLQITQALQPAACS